MNNNFSHLKEFQKKFIVAPLGIKFHHTSFFRVSHGVTKMN